MAGCFLENGISPQETVFCPGYAKLGNQVFRCWKHSGHGSQNLEQALFNSCDVYFYLMAERVGINKISAYTSACGLGAQTGIDLPNERSGIAPQGNGSSTATKEAGPGVIPSTPQSDRDTRWQRLCRLQSRLQPSSMAARF